ncbi:MAG: chromate transporter, partial [Acidobacteriota bacterium]
SYSSIEHRPVVQDFTRGLALGVVGLTLAVALGLASSTIADWGGIFVAMGAFGLALSKRVPVLVIFFLAAVAGIVFYGI